jgi:hypothetical protein
MDEILLLATTDGTKMEYWAAVGTPEMALMEVRKHLPSGWLVTLSATSLTPREMVALNLNMGTIRALKLTEEPDSE